MKKRIALVAFILLASASGLAQEKNPLDHPGCKLYFSIIWADPKIPLGYMAHMTKPQMDWYEKKGVKKYPTVCFDVKKATHWVVWTRQSRTYVVNLPVFHQSTTQITGDVDATATTTWYQNEPVTRRVEDASVFIFSTVDGKAVHDGGRLSPAPLYYAEHTGRWRWSKPTKDVLEDALKFLASVAPE